MICWGFLGLGLAWLSLGVLWLQESKGIHTGPYHACIADISRELKSVAYAQQESFENIQAEQRSSDGEPRKRELYNWDMQKKRISKEQHIFCILGYNSIIR